MSEPGAGVARARQAFCYTFITAHSEKDNMKAKLYYFEFWRQLPRHLESSMGSY